MVILCMRVLNLSLDREVSDPTSLVAKRLAELSVAVGEIVVLAPNGKESKVYQFFDLWWRAKEVLQERRCDLITVQDTAYLALLAYMLAKKFRVPLEVQVHGFERFRGVRKMIAWFVIKRADKIRVVSDRLRREISARAYVLPVYTQIPSQPPPYKGGEEGGDFVFLTVGRLVPVKNIGLQIRAFARIAKEFPNARLVIVGDGPERDNLPTHGCVIFEGAQKDLRRFYKDADAFLFTSNSEGWGVVVTEAAAYGLPIIMTDVGCAGEFIKNGENGLVIPVGDEDALVAAMKRIIKDGELRVHLGNAARRAFLSFPTAQVAIQKQVEAWASFK